MTVLFLCSWFPAPGFNRDNDIPSPYARLLEAFDMLNSIPVQV